MAAHSADTDLDPPQGPGHLHVTSDEEEEGDVCRICRCSGSSDNALFHPCKCSGSIKYVHQDCLTHWLQHSGNTHCEVCKHKFVFTPVYAKDAPVTLPWHELAVGLVSRAARAIKVAHRVWVVSCVWLIVVPWITCLAWRISFLRSFNEVPRLLRERCHVLAVATDCIQGSLLSIGIVFLNIAFTGLKDQVKAAVTSLEHQLMRDTGPAAAAAAAPLAVAEVAAAPAAGQAAAAAAGGGALAPGVAAAGQGAAAAAGEAAADAGAAPGSSAAGSSSAAAAAAGGGGGAAGAASSSSSADSATSAQLPPWSGAPGASNEATAVQQQQQHNAPELLQDQQQQLPAVAGPGGAPADLAPAGAAGNDIHDVLAVVDADAGADPARDDADAWGDVPFEELLGLQGPWVNFFETIVLVMIGNACFMAGVVYVPLNIGRLLLMLLRRACAMMPLEQQLSLRQALSQPSQSALADEFANFMLAALANVPAAAAEEGAAAAVAAAAEDVAGVGAGVVAGAVEAAASAVNATAAAVAANVTAVAAAVATNASAGVAATAANVTAIAAAAVGAVGPAAMAGSLVNNTTAIVLDAVGAASSTAAGDADAAAAALLHPAAVLDAEPLPLVVPLRFDLVFKELQAQLELPASADFMALTLGHMLLVGLLILVLWLYVSVRLWTAARRRVQRSGQPLIQVVKSICRWVLSAVSMVGKGAKLMLLLCLELGAFPLAAGLWLDICALPLTSTSLGQRGELLAKTPLIAGFMHWVLGVGFLLGCTFLVCVVREVLRPGALPFLKDPTNPERNPVQEMLDEPLLRHLARVAVTWVAYAGLCVVTVHLPALLAQALVPSLYPLRVALFDPLTQIPADMLLLHIFIPFTVEHVRVKGAVKAAVTWWLTWAGRLLGWSEYLLPAAPPAEAPQPAAAAAAAVPVAVLAPAAAEAGTEEQVEQVPSTGSEEPAAVAAAPEPGPSSTAAAAPAAAAAAAAAATGGMPPASLASGKSTRKNSHPPSPLAAFDLQPGLLQGGDAAAPGPSQSAQQQEQQEQQAQQQHGTGLDHLHQPLLTAPAPAADHQQHQQQPRPVQYFEQQPCYTRKLLGLGLSWLASVVLLNCLLLTVPIGLGRALFHALRLPFKNDLFTGAIGLLAMWGSYSLAAGVATSANVRNVKAVLLAAGRWLLLAGQCAVLLVLWLGVVATMLGMLCELVLLPLRLPPNQTALIYLYQDWTMGVLALKLWHLLVMVTPRRDGRLPPDPDSWQAHFDALQAGGLRNLDFNRALTKIVLPVLLNLATSLALPYVVTRGLLPLLGLPAIALQYANLYGHQAYHGVYLAWLGSKKLHQVAVRLHDTIRDDRYLVGRELRNFELQQQQEQEAERLRQQQLQEQQQQEEAPAVAASEAADEGRATAGSSAVAQAVVHGVSAVVTGPVAGGEISVAL